MTKIKNTKKGMAKKTLSMSLVVAMLATSNVPVWAAEFSDGSDDVAVATEAPAAETFSDAAAEAPVVEDTDATAAEATTNGIGYDITASAFAGVSNNEIKWGDKTSAANTVSTDIKVVGNKNKTDGATLHYVWKDADGQIGSVSNITAADGTATPSITLSSELSNKQLSLFVYAEKDGTVVWSWTSDAFTVKPIDINDAITVGNSDDWWATTDIAEDPANSIPAQKAFDKEYTGKDVIPTMDNFVNNKFTNGFSKSDFVIGSTKGDTVNVTDKGVDVYLTVNKTGYTGSLVINYKISPKELTSRDVSDYLEATFVTTSKPYTGNAITLKNTDLKLVDKKTGVDLSSYIPEGAVFTLGTNNQTADVQAGKQYNTGKAGDVTLGMRVSDRNLLATAPTTSKYKNYTIANDVVIAPTNSFTIAKRNLNTVNVSIPEKAYQNGAIVTVDPTTATYTDKTTGEVLNLGTDVVITSTATTQGVHDDHVSGTLPLVIIPCDIR